MIHRVDEVLPGHVMTAFTVKAVYPAEELAIAEVARLMELKGDKSCRYAYQVARWFSELA